MRGAGVGWLEVCALRFSMVVGGLLLGLAAEVRAGELARVSGVEPGEVGVLGFTLERVGEVEIEAVGLVGALGLEERSAAWVLDAESRETVWEMGDGRAVAETRRTSRYRERARLEAGSYEVYYAVRAERSEGEDAIVGVVRGMVGASVSPRELAALGVTVHGEGKPLGEAAVERARRRDGLLVDLGGLGDDVREVRGFVLGEPAEVEVYALGELGPGFSSDIGWILDADRREVVWELTWEGSEPAGGSSLNRVARARLQLPAGRYAAEFVTDGGHSAAGWSGSPPRDPAFWGLTVRCPAGCGGAVPFEIEPLPRRLVAAELTGLGDGERRELPFALGGPARLWLYAVGEGIGGRMYDHGWIEDAATGDRVWTMDYERTRPAGGSVKNRLADELVELPAGRYVAVYETDGSHSAGGGWNAEPPAEPERWGLTILAPESGLVPR